MVTGSVSSTSSSVRTLRALHLRHLRDRTSRYRRDGASEPVCASREAAHVDREVARTLTARRTNDVGSHVDTSQNVHSGNASGNRTHDVGLEAITHGERVARADEFARTTVDAGLRLSASGRRLRVACWIARTRAIAQRLTALDGKRRVEVGRVECRATLDSECALREKRPSTCLSRP